MCFIVFAYDCHPDYLLVLAANRDEYHARPTSPARFWKEAPDVLAGKDLEQSGTWLVYHSGAVWRPLPITGIRLHTN